MAAYAAVVNLLNILDQIQDHPRLSITFQQNQIQLLKEKLHFLLDYIESCPPLHRGIKEEAETLEREIASAAYAAEDVIETHIVDQIQAAAEPSSPEKRSLLCLPLFRVCEPKNPIPEAEESLLDLEKVIQDMDYVKEKVATFKQFQLKHLNPTTYYPPTSASSETPDPTTTEKSTMVGFDDMLYQLTDVLTGHEPALQITPIVGMGGIGKTTLAKAVYENSVILQRFDIRAWATISQEYSVKHIFSNLLSRDAGKSGHETEYQKLAQEFYQSLIGRRYLIVLDDMWSIDVWDAIKFFFPDNNNGSRVVVTTRLSNMASHLGTSHLPLQLLDEDSSWKLFCQKAFPNEAGCPSELVEIGMRIAKKCKGLPLLIVVIGALLRKSSRTREHWENISNDINSILNTGEEEIKDLDVLQLSYQHLPAHLKPCFLYLGIYPEDHFIRASRLIKLWVAEGFVKSNKTENLEEIAWGYLKDLIDRNLLISRSSKWNGKTKTCQMHDLLRDLCLKIGEKERFLCVIRAGDIQQGIVDKARRIVFQTTPDFDGLKSTTWLLTRSLVSDQNLGSIQFKLLRVFNVVYNYSYRYDILKQVNLRYVCVENDSRYNGNPRGLLSSISLLWNLQTLIIRQGRPPCIVPPEIWEMRQLRHVRGSGLQFPDPPLSTQPADEFVQLNLQSLKTAWNLRLSEEVCKRIHDVKELTIVYNDLSGNLSFDFGRLHKLQFLKCRFDEKPNLDPLLQSLTFPSSLQKLSLQGCHLRWEDLSMIGSLPHLQFLYLEENAVTGSEWSPTEGGFICLRSLDIFQCDMINWNIDSDDYYSSTFPVLEKLVLNGLLNLNEIPSCIGEIPTLGFVHLRYCSESACISAMKILEEQESLGNEGLQVLIEFWDDEVLRSFQEKVQDMDCLISTNLQLRYMS